MAIFNVLFKPNKPYVLSTHWPWWEFEVLGVKLIRFVTKADTIDDAMEEIYKAHVPLHEKDFININTVVWRKEKEDFIPFNDDFLKQDWMKWE
jgi:hypothetical protein